MALSDRYTRVLLASSALNLAKARKSRSRLAEVRAQLKQKRAESDEILDYAAPDNGSPSSPAPPVLLSSEMEKQLAALGYKPADIKTLIPEQAQEIIDGGITLKKREEMSSRREEAFDDLEEHVVDNLDAIKKRLDAAKKKLALAEAASARLDASLAEVEEKRYSGPVSEQAKLKLKSEWIQKHIDQLQKSENAIKANISALEKLVISVNKVEHGLIEELQQANEAALQTVTVEDDDIIAQLMKSKKVELDKLSSLRKKLFDIQKRFDKEMDAIIRYHIAISKHVDKNGKKADLNFMRIDMEKLQDKVKSIGKEREDVVREIFKHEDSLRDIKTEERLKNLDKILENLPEELESFDKLKQKSKEQIAPDDVGKDIAEKPKKYKQQADAMLSFMDTTSQHYGDFILSFLAPDIPSDPKIESFIKSANAIILKRAGESKKLSESYGRNPMHRSAILLVPALYEFLASTMNGVVSPEDGDALAASAEVKAASAKEMEDIALELAKLGFVKEALGFRDMIDSAKDKGRAIKDDFSALVDSTKEVGQGVGDLASSAWDKAKGLAQRVQDMVRQVQEVIDRNDFEKKDTGNRRDPKEELRRKQLGYQALIEAERVVRKNMLDLSILAKNHQAENHEKAAAAARDGIIQLQQQLKILGQRKEVALFGLGNNKPSDGMMKDQENAARRPSSDKDKAVALMAMGMPKLQEFLTVGIPDDAKLERELLRQSQRIVDAINRMVSEGFKAKKKYPNLPPTIAAYGHMFLAIDDALQKSLRKEERERAPKVDRSKFNTKPSDKKVLSDEEREEKTKEYEENGLLPETITELEDSDIEEIPQPPAVPSNPKA